MSKTAILIAISLILFIGSNSFAGDPKIYEPKIYEMKEPKFLELSKPKYLQISKPKYLQISEPKSLESGVFLKGKYTPAKRENKAYLRCAKLKGFSALLQCALDALGISPEALN